VSASSSKVLVTGCAGFLGSHLCEALLARGDTVIGVDSFSDYYARSVKESNLASVRDQPRFTLLESDLARDPLGPALGGVDSVFHLAAQPGVRLSFGHGFGAYLRDNVQATQRLLEAVAGRELSAFVYASSSSVYGDQDVYPVTEDAPLRPVSPYGATKVITEQLAGGFWRSAGIPVVGLRYFTVYGPRQRPDMAFARFLGRALADRPLPVLGDGRQVREFTYVQDVISATISAAERGTPGAVYNVGGGVPVSLLEVIDLLGELLGRAPAVEHREAAIGDPRRTDADITRAARELGYRPATSLAQGLTAQLKAVRAWPAAVAPLTARRHAGIDRGRHRRPSSAPPGAAGAGPRVLAYSHDGYGLGHLRRNLRIVSGLRRQRPDLEALLVTGAKSAKRLTAPFALDCVQLAPVAKVANGRYVSGDDGGSVEDVMRARSAAILDAVRRFVPDLILVDRYPRGMHDELAPALRQHAAQRPGAPAVLGLRDILDRPETIRAEWRTNGYSAAIRETYPMVLCYGDPTVYDPVSEYGLPDDIAARIRFTGYLADDLLAAGSVEVQRRHRDARGRLAVCTLGGGRDASPIAESFLSAMAELEGRGWSGVLITGPYMAPEDVERLQRHEATRSVSILRMVDDVPSYLAAADAAVCMGGYNTVCELLALAVPAVIVPRIHPREEQRMRAERLGARGLVQWIEPTALSPSVLAAGIERVSGIPRDELAGRIGRIDHRGIQAAAQQLAALLPAAEVAETIAAQAMTTPATARAHGTR